MKKIILIALAFILAACSVGGSELSRNQQKWDSANIAHYRFTLGIGCFCVFRSQMPLTVEVLNGEVVSMATSDGSALPTTDANYAYYSSYATMDRLFSQIESDPIRKADEVTVKYDSTRGFPSEIYFDYIKAAADDELSLSVSNFEVLK